MHSVSYNRNVREKMFNSCISCSKAHDELRTGLNTSPNYIIHNENIFLLVFQRNTAMVKHKVQAQKKMQEWTVRNSRPLFGRRKRKTIHQTQYDYFKNPPYDSTIH